MTPTTLIGLAAAGVGVAVVYGMVVYGDDLKTAAKDALDAITPTNPENVFARGANAVTRTITGDQHDTLGTWIHSWFHDDSGADIVAPVPIIDVRPGAPASSAQGAANGHGPAPTIPGSGPVNVYLM